MDELRATYEQVPYPQLAYSQTHPDRLATIATLLGLAPTPIEDCRVLELGCASGGNLLPMAHTLPGSTFVGVDFSEQQIAEAQEAVDVLGLENIAFHQMDIREIGADFGQFDYIIAHGVYSWVPPDVREHVMMVCQQNLAPNGLALISYNTYPGWHMLGMVREMMLFHTRHIQNPSQKAAQARELMEFLAANVGGNEAYQAFLQSYLHHLDKQIEHAYPRKDSALLHDELEVFNDPLYFYQFAEHAAAYGLQYVAEADFGGVMTTRFPRPVQERLAQMASSLIEIEQYMDFLRSRLFRQTLLCHEALTINRKIQLTPVVNFYIASQAKTVETEGEVQRFKTSGDAAFATDHPVTKVAFHYLMEVAPRVVTFRELVAAVGAQTEQDAQILAANLLQAHIYDMKLVEFHSFDPPFVAEVSDRPTVSAFVRHQIKAGPKVTNRRHERVMLDGMSYLLVRYLDGTHDRTALLDLLVQQAVAGAVELHHEGTTITDPDRIRERMARELDTTLNYLARSALLIA